MSGKSYTCASCGGTFLEMVSEEDAEAEYRQLFPDSAIAGVPREVVCDDCFKAMMSALPPAMWESERPAGDAT